MGLAATFPRMRIEGNGFIVTGGASGLGLATARALRTAGAEVGVIDRAGTGAWDGAFAQADVSNEDQVAGALASLRPALGAIRGMANAAGGGGAGLCVGPNATLTVRGFRRALEINTLGSFIMSTLVAGAMLESEPDETGERGVLINVSSIVAIEGQMGTSGYAAAKGGISAMTLPLARELAPHGIRVMAIAPGIFDTPMFNRAGEAGGAMNQGLRAAVQFPPRPGQPDEFAAMVRHIIENPMLNGSVLRLDGAYRVPTRRPLLVGRLTANREPAGWAVTDPLVLHSLGQGSAAPAAPVCNLLVPRYDGLLERLSAPGAAILDIGTGVGALAASFANRFPDATVLGLDVGEPSLDLARMNLARAALTDRVDVSHQDIAEFARQDAFDLVWFAGPFIAAAILEQALARTAAATRPGGIVVYGTFGGADPLTSALADLRILRSGGPVLTDAEIATHLERAGLVHVEPRPPTSACPPASSPPNTLTADRAEQSTALPSGEARRLRV